MSVLYTSDNSLAQKVDVTAEDDTPLHELLGKALRRFDPATYSFQRVELLVLSPSTCVPLEYFRREEVFSLYHLTFPSLTVSKPEVHYQILPSLEVVELFSLNQQLLQTVQAVCPDVQILSLEGRAIEDIAAADRKRQEGGIHFYAMIAPRNMLVCCLLEQRLHLATTYQADNDADRLYYIMGVWKSLKMDEKTQALYLNNASQELLAQAKRFILNTTVCEL